MGLDNRRGAATFILAVVWLGGCQPRAPEGDTSQSPAPPSASADTTSSATSDTAIVRADSVVLTTDKSQYRAGEAMIQGARAAERQIDEIKSLVGDLVA